MNTTIPMLMSEVKDGYYVVDAADDYVIRIEPGEYQVIAMPYDVKRTPGLAAFTHPNMVRSRTREEEVKHKQHDWRKHTIANHVFVVPRDRILLLPEKTYTYPLAEIGGEQIQFSTSGGTCGHGWGDWINTIVHTTWGHSKTKLLAVASAAVRGTSFEPFLFHDEIEEAFYAEHAADWLTYSAIGRCSWVDIPEDMVKVDACIGGYRYTSPRPPEKTRVFLVPAADYHTRGNLPFVVDPLKYQEVISDQPC